MAKLTKNYNLEVILPDLALEWHPTKNGILRPSDFTPSSNKKVWWICKNGHEWHVPIILRKKGQGCPYCSGQRVCIDNCLQTKFPEIAKQWHPEKNNVLSPLNVTSGTGIKVWWRCDQNHEWEAAISNRTSGRGCPVCNKFRATKENCLQNVNPVVSKEWHPIKNGNLKPQDVASNSRRKIWWICNKGHIWKAAVYSRNKGHGCPYCTGQKVCIDNCLMKINPKLAQSWHCTKNKPLTPFKVTSKSNKKVWWVCDQGHEWEATINSQSYGGGCPTCKGLKRYKKFHEITETSSDIIFDVDLKQTVEYISPAIKKILGYNAYEVIGNNFNSIVLFSDLPIADDAFQAALSGKYCEFQRIKVKSKDGKKIPLEIILFPIIDNQKVIGVHGIARVIAFALESPRL